MIVSLEIVISFIPEHASVKKELEDNPDIDVFKLFISSAVIILSFFYKGEPVEKLKRFLSALTRSNKFRISAQLNA